MGNMFNAHIFRRRSVGEREEVRLKLFNLDGTPFEGGGGAAGPSESPLVTDWANLTLKDNLHWMTQDLAQWRRNGDYVELRGTCRKLFGNSAGAGANDFADALPEEHWPSRDTTAQTALSVSTGYQPVILFYGVNGRLQVSPDETVVEPLIYLDGVKFVL
jgi:hypothetical protein